MSDRTALAAAASHTTVIAGSAAGVVAAVCLGVVAFAWSVKDHYDKAIFAAAILGFAAAGLGWAVGFRGFIGSVAGGLALIAVAVFMTLYALHHMQTKKKAHRRALIAAFLAPLLLAGISWVSVGHQIGAWVNSQSSKAGVHTANVVKGG